MKTENGRDENLPVSGQPQLPRRRKISLLRCLLLACLLAGAAAPAFAVQPLTLDLALNGLKQARPPHLVGDVLILSYQPTDGPVRFVGARFDTENYTVLHTFSRNQYGVFVLDYEVPENTHEIRYRLVVDGLCVNDPSDPVTETDELGNLISLFTIEQEPERTILNPRVEPDGSVTFTYRGAPGRRVTIQGDFNNWDPFMDPLVEVEPGLYRITLHLLPGSHGYRFYSDGHRFLDRYNSDTARDPDGEPVSFFQLSPQKPDP